MMIFKAGHLLLRWLWRAGCGSMVRGAAALAEARF